MNNRRELLASVEPYGTGMIPVKKEEFPLKVEGEAG